MNANTIVLLDTGILGLITHPKITAEADACNRWIASLMAQGVEFNVPEISDYELRRELLRLGKTKSIKRLDELKILFGYVPLTTRTMLLAAQFWAQVRQQGKPTTDNKALDGDVILAAQATIIAAGGQEVIVATTNVAHLSRFVSARKWQEIT